MPSDAAAWKTDSAGAGVGDEKVKRAVDEDLDNWLAATLGSRKGRKALYKALADPTGFLAKSGWIETLMSKSPVWRGEPVPWVNYGVIRFLEGRIGPAMRVFEYGAGSSTLWWAKRVARVDAVEHDAAWAERVTRELAPPATVTRIELDYDGAYCRSILRLEGFVDIVVVDGRDRVNCLRQSLSRLAPDGVVIFDDSHREKYRTGIEDVKRSAGFKELQLSGIAPAKQIESFTSILYRGNNVLGI